MTSRRQLVIDTWRAAWDLGDVDALDRLLAPGYLRFSVADAPGLDRDAFKATVVTTRASFPDLTTTIEDLLIDGDRMAVRWQSTGTHTHSFLGVPATKRKITVSGATFATFGADGLVHSENVTWDPRGLLTAIGVISVGQDS
ncbi:ester cyclase [Actinoplanes couchii]|uniref:Ester cyclase n=1 Tax=Actinoplanes couchii TaxID=403638 RepID=A0ABQ3XG22_9ACTN|nr:ester cyclase [Actinoplanes couchii]MDR6320929.1 steroid delta-isomerase-like uncharacterized protein [Actinoplanes couchii]GID57441.1 hypothetical protein Aco03nite_058450 [Actinoplanes couchii]